MRKIIRVLFMWIVSIIFISLSLLFTIAMGMVVYQHITGRESFETLLKASIMWAVFMSSFTFIWIKFMLMLTSQQGVQ